MTNTKTPKQIRAEAKECLNGFYKPTIFMLVICWIIVMLANAAMTSVFDGLYNFIFRTIYGNDLTVNMSIISVHSVFSIAYTELTTLIISIIVSVFDVGIALYFLKLTCKQPASTADLFAPFTQDMYKRSLFIVFVYQGIRWLAMLPFSVLTDYVDSQFNLYVLKSYIPLIAVFGIVGYILAFVAKLFIYQIFFLIHDFPNMTGGELVLKSIDIMKTNWQQFLILELSFIPYYLLAVLSFGVGLFWVIPFVMTARTKFFLNIMKAN